MNQQTKAPKNRYKLVVQYDGSPFCGWQYQPGLNTVQGELEKAIRSATHGLYLKSGIKNPKISVVGSGRTDSGVHAWAQSAHLDFPFGVRCEWLLRSVNGLLPPEIRIRSCELAPPDFHAIRSAKRKTYRYLIENSQLPSPLLRGQAWHLFSNPSFGYKELDLDRMNEACQVILGEHDFSAFQTAGSSTKTTVREVFQAKWVQEKSAITPGRLLLFRIQGSGFLKQMVRNLVGTMAEIGKGRRDLSSLEELLKGGSRQEAGPAAPPKGLALEKVEY
jgi:tRNA pseudouridine38-40 synthase